MRQENWFFTFGPSWPSCRHSGYYSSVSPTIITLISNVDLNDSIRKAKKHWPAPQSNWYLSIQVWALLKTYPCTSLECQQVFSPWMCERWGVDTLKASRRGRVSGWGVNTQAGLEIHAHDSRRQAGKPTYLEEFFAIIIVFNFNAFSGQFGNLFWSFCFLVTSEIRFGPMSGRFPMSRLLVCSNVWCTYFGLGFRANCRLFFSGLVPLSVSYLVKNVIVHYLQSPLQA